ncbi:hypothetical protein LIA77_05822 [Sarocladium implicatum]|nr:hypothetical protein LIA77_05822 [Sarocladium implicatum]
MWVDVKVSGGSGGAWRSLATKFQRLAAPGARRRAFRAVASVSNAEGAAQAAIGPPPARIGLASPVLRHARSASKSNHSARNETGMGCGCGIQQSSRDAAPSNTSLAGHPDPSLLDTDDPETGHRAPLATAGLLCGAMGKGPRRPRGPRGSQDGTNPCLPARQQQLYLLRLPLALPTAHC